MKTTELVIPEVGLIALTRAILGMGVGLLVSGKVREQTRRPVGWSLVAVGVLTTFPLLATVFARRPKKRWWQR